VPLLVTTPHWLGVLTLDLKLTTQEVLAPGCSLGYNVKGKCPSVMTLHSLRPLFILFSGVMPPCQGFSLHKKIVWWAFSQVWRALCFLWCSLCNLHTWNHVFLCTREPTRGVIVLVVPSIKDHKSLFWLCYTLSCVFKIYVMFSNFEVFYACFLCSLSCILFVVLVVFFKNISWLIVGFKFCWSCLLRQGYCV